MKYLVLVGLFTLTSCSGLIPISDIKNTTADRRVACIKLMYELGIKAEEVVKVCQFVEER